MNVRHDFRVVVVGMGVQGPKRRKAAGEDYVGSVDPVKKGVDFSFVEDIPLGDYDAAIVSVPDKHKVQILEYLLSNGKHVLVEKPLWAGTAEEILHLNTLARKNNVLCMTAYNHRFEPHFIRMHELINSKELGEIYRCRMFYGNGTARLVRDSEWRDTGAGVLPDLGSHLLDTAAFWFGELGDDFNIISANCFENKSPDHVIIGSETTRPKLELEMTLLMWRNHFTCDVFAEKGSAHIESLCKWGPTTFTKRTRILPSGLPEESTETLEQKDPTWDLEYRTFKSRCLKRAETDLSNDLWLQNILRKLSAKTLEKIDS